jgi:transposase
LGQNCRAKPVIPVPLHGTIGCLSKRLIARTGAPWRDLPEEFGNWYTVYTRFWRWARKGVWGRIFKMLSNDPDLEYVLLDATHIRVHQHGTGAKGGLAIRRSANRAAV